MKTKLFVSIVILVLVGFLLAGCGVPTTFVVGEHKDEEKDSLFSTLPENAVDPIACKNGVFYLTPEEKDKGFFIAHYPEKDGYYCIVSFMFADRLSDPNWDGFYGFDIMEAGGHYGNVLLFAKYTEDADDDDYVELLTLAALTGYDSLRDHHLTTYETMEVWLGLYSTPQRVSILREIGVPLDPNRELKGEPVEIVFPIVDKDSS